LALSVFAVFAVLVFPVMSETVKSIPFARQDAIPKCVKRFGQAPTFSQALVGGGFVVNVCDPNEIHLVLKANIARFMTFAVAITFCVFIWTLASTFHGWFLFGCREWI
jgi:hypothetical protein